LSDWIVPKSRQFRRNSFGFDDTLLSQQTRLTPGDGLQGGEGAAITTNLDSRFRGKDGKDVDFESRRSLVTAEPLDFKAGWMRRWVECYGEIVEEANLAQEIVGNIPREACLDLDDVRSDYEFYIVKVNL
jgi:hypothetical protein